MSDTLRAIIVIAIGAAVTICMRFLPFAVFKGRKTPEIITYLGKVLPFAIMGMLVVYCLKGVSFSSIGGWLPELISCAVVVIVYVISKKTILSILGGTVCYMALVQLVFCEGGLLG